MNLFLEWHALRTIPPKAQENPSFIPTDKVIDECFGKSIRPENIPVLNSYPLPAKRSNALPDSTIESR